MEGRRVITFNAVAFVAGLICGFAVALIGVALLS
jgi:hypothetical protein